MAKTLLTVMHAKAQQLQQVSSLAGCKHPMQFHGQAEDWLDACTRVLAAVVELLCGRATLLTCPHTNLVSMHACLVYLCELHSCQLCKLGWW
jgi:hypothetical protein